MAIYRITGIGGGELGCFEGVSPEAALDALARDMGYSSHAAACEAVGNAPNDWTTETFAFKGGTIGMLVEVVPAALSRRAEKIVETVETWHVPPAAQGQMVEHAYGVAEDGIAMMRVTNKSEATVAYYSGDDVRDDWDPANDEPEGYEWEPLA